MDCKSCEADAAFLRAKRRPDYEVPARRIRVVDLFCSGGGLSLGFAEAARRNGRGTKIVAAVDLAGDAADIYQRNFPGSTVMHDDVAALFDGAPGAAATSRETTFRRRVGSVDLLLAGPPCQGHSDLNNHTRRDDGRNDLYIRVARAAEVLRPKAVLIENVPTIQHDRRGSLPTTRRILEAANYRVACVVLDLTALGVPQRRRRHLLLAVRDVRLDPDELLSAGITCGGHEPRTVAWAIRDLAGKTTERGIDAPSQATAENRARMRWLIDHEQHDLPNRLRPSCHHNAHSYVSMYGRLRWDRPAQTITTGYGSPGQGRYVHPADARTLTPHEAARLQTLPDFFDLGAEKPRAAWAHVIGNAVPPLVGIHIGTPLIGALMSVNGSGATRARATVRAGKGGSGDRRSRRPGVPAASNQLIRQRMQATKRRDTRPELLLRSELYRQGMRYRVDYRVDGRRRADIVFKGPRVAVYVDGCYWHGCPIHGTISKSHTKWWKDKLEANRRRDADTEDRLALAGWTVLRFWEHDDPVEAAAKVIAVVRSKAGAGC